MGKPFEIIPYSIARLKQVLQEKSGALATVVDGKLHTVYFKNYFDDLKAKTIIVENDYVDKDFLEDYAGFYSRCFGKYESSCTRLHFFQRSFSPREFSYTLIGRGKTLTESDLQDSYLGFVVVKRLPETYVGRTCLKTYDSDNGRRFYPTLRRYPVNLFGVELSVEGTLAFQEQDRGVAACATSALWTLFQGTGKLYQHSILSPVEITKIATKIPDEMSPSSLPARGLTGRQEIHAIRQQGLEADYTDAQKPFNLQGTVYAYLMAGIPLVLRIRLWDLSQKATPRLMGGHAVTVTGFSLGNATTRPYGTTKFSLSATRIDKLYVHDDQVGPFARMLLATPISVKSGSGNKVSINTLTTSWRGKNGIIGSARAMPQFLIVPLYPKIRIRFEFIRKLVVSFDKYFSDRLNAPSTNLPSFLEWDIHLTTISKLKTELKKSPFVTDSEKRRIALWNMPRFIWRAKALFNGKPQFDLLFDATDIEQGPFVINIASYNRHVFDFLKTVARLDSANRYYHTKPYWRIIEWLSKAK